MSERQSLLFGCFKNRKRKHRFNLPLIICFYFVPICSNLCCILDQCELNLLYFFPFVLFSYLIFYRIGNSCKKMRNNFGENDSIDLFKMSQNISGQVLFVFSFLFDSIPLLIDDLNRWCNNGKLLDPIIILIGIVCARAFDTMYVNYIPVDPFGPVNFELKLKQKKNKIE